MKTKNGFKVHDGTSVYINKNGNKGRIKTSTINTIRKTWNSDPSIKKMKKHVKAISIYKSQNSSTSKETGTWTDSKNKLTIKIHDGVHDFHYKGVVYHEVVGHAFWHWAKKYRAEELKKFNIIANGLPPVNGYVKKHERKWRRMRDGTTLEQTEYANEQHSAITEVIHKLEEGRDHTCLLNNKDKNKLIKAYEELHY